MRLMTLMAVAAALLAMGAAPKRPSPAKPAPAKPAAAAPAAKPEPAGDFDARNPQSLMALLNASGGKAEISKKEEDSVLVGVTSLAANFSMQFVGCNAQGRACRAVQFDNLADQRAGPTFAQMNAFNQTSALCRGYEDKTGKPHVIYSTLLFDGDSKGRMAEQFRAWTGCIGEFRNFLKDPNAYLASAP